MEGGREVIRTVSFPFAFLGIHVYPALFSLVRHVLVHAPNRLVVEARLLFPLFLMRYDDLHDARVTQASSDWRQCGGGTATHLHTHIHGYIVDDD